MAHTRVWEEATPVGTEDAALGDDRIRNLKVDLGERLEDLLYGFNVSDGTGDEATPGVKVLNFKEQASIATPSANQINVAAKEGTDGDAKAEIFAEDEDGNERQLTKTSGSALRLNVKAGDYAADSIDQDDIRLANNGYMTARNQAGDGDVNIVKVNTSDEVEVGEDGTTIVKLADGSKLASNTAPGGETEIPNKKYVDDTPHTGGIVQIVNTQTGAVDTGTTQMPSDDTIPQKTEGNELMTLAITPTSASNKLKIDVVIIVAISTGTYVELTAALFQDDTAGALAAVSQYVAYENKPNIIKFTHYMNAGTTSETTFKVRAGSDQAGTLTFNGASSARLYGGVMASSITITEIKT